MTIYVVNMGGFWRFTPKQWAAFVPKALEAVRAGNGFELSEEKMLSHCPRGIYVDDSSGQAHYTARIEGIRVVEPHDWDVSEWENELRWIEGHFRLTGEMDRLAKFIAKGKRP
jgi:hypothetical protein